MRQCEKSKDFEWMAVVTQGAGLNRNVALCWILSINEEPAHTSGREFPGLFIPLELYHTSLSLLCKKDNC